MPFGMPNGTNGVRHDPEVEILSMAVNYPKERVYPAQFEEFRKRHYADTEVMLKTMALNRRTGIKSRPSVLDLDGPLVNGPKTPSINDLDAVFRDVGIRLSVQACQKVIEQWGGDMKDITHMFSMTCTHTGNPGFDAIVARELGLKLDTERVLIHGTGCSGGLSVIRTAFNILQAETFRQRPARALVLATDIPTTLARSSLDDVTPEAGVNIGPILFSDCSTAYIMSNGIKRRDFEKPIYQVMNCKHALLPGTEDEITFNIDVTGYKSVVSKKVPFVCGAAIGPLFQEFLKRTPEAPNHVEPDPRQFDWALHPGGISIVDAVRQSLQLDHEHLRASYDIYTNNGNSSSTTVLNVIDRLPQMGDGRKDVIACAMGPGINVEMSYLRRVETK
uniref:Valerophenone synthase n=1 Tax=Coccidioides posadasii RMSCC 3488 TaxID=454284 RepID=A0A0J6I0F9_COCPO|nr:valerophenone synthase [Coccidioides posadasii RMSCC 3488]